MQFRYLGCTYNHFIVMLKPSYVLVIFTSMWCCFFCFKEKSQVEKELEKLKGRLEKEFVSRRELDHMKMRARADETSELSTKLAQVNKLLLQQVLTFLLVILILKKIMCRLYIIILLLLYRLMIAILDEQKKMLMHKFVRNMKRQDSIWFQNLQKCRHHCKVIATFIHLLEEAFTIFTT